MSDPLDAARAIVKFSVPVEPTEGGPNSVHKLLNASIGKTIASLEFGATKADPEDPQDANSEILILQFTDGAALKLEIGLASLGTSFIASWPGDDSEDFT